MARYLRAAGTRLLDALDTVVGRADPALPPRRLRRLAGDGDYDGIANHLTELARDLGGLSPTARVLDVGSGTGRVALGLTRYLAPEASYDGLEIVRSAVAWCERAFTTRYPNFRFHHLDLHHGMYNPRGRLDPDALEFPFAAASFDFAILTSVFTHLRRSTIDRYLGELARVLVPGGRVMVTFFLLNGDSEQRIASGSSELGISHPLDDTGAKIADLDVIEFAIGHPEQPTLELIDRHGFELVGPTYYGTWCGRPRGATWQDLLVLERR
jgi:SAM-dependent methyltransferase